MEENQKAVLRLKEYIKCTKNTIRINNKTFYLDMILKTSQENIFNNVAKDLTQDFINGYNCTLLAYGQTGSGKTYTIQGTQHDVGIVQRSLFYVFNNVNFTELKISYVEIYNENVYDLFSENIKQASEMRENPFDGVYLENLTYKKPKKYEEAVDYFYEGVLQRKTAETKMNMESSRSHSIFTIYLESIDNKIKKRSKMHIVDLAGSERMDYKCTDERMKECSSINKSLLYLGILIEKLSNNDMHINYRDSKLTYMLKDCLGGNSKLVVIGCIDYNKENEYKNKENEHKTEENNTENEGSKRHKKENENVYDSKISKIDEAKHNQLKIKNINLYETINTLEFLQRIKSIKNVSELNAEIDSEDFDIKKEYKELFLKYQALKKKEVKKTLVCNKKDIEILKMRVIYIKEMLEQCIVECEETKTRFIDFIKHFYNKKTEEIEKIKELKFKIKQENIERKLAKNRR
ncbi:Kinesin-like protein kif17 [Binucleata daphniae]